MALADPAERVLLVERVDTGPADDLGGVPSKAMVAGPRCGGGTAPIGGTHTP